MTENLAESREERLEILRGLYPLYKEEVYRRREQMMRLTATGSALLLLLLFVIMWTTPHLYNPTMAILMITGVSTFSFLIVYLIVQQGNRHQLAKQSLIEIERALGLYQEGFFLDHKSLYPQNWQTAWLSDRSVTVYIAVIMMLTILLIVAIYLHVSI